MGSNHKTINKLAISPKQFFFSSPAEKEIVMRLKNRRFLIRCLICGLIQWSDIAIHQIFSIAWFIHFFEEGIKMKIPSESKPPLRLSEKSKVSTSEII